MEFITRHFAEIPPEQIQALQAYHLWLQEKNKSINLISRKDTEKILLHHISHSLLLNKSQDIKSKMKILDIGTGGGLPGIPLAITNPETEFHLIDSILKKTKAVNEAIDLLGLKNITCSQARAEKEDGKYDIIVSRAVARLNKLWNWSRPLFNGKKHNALICLKGGNLKEEIQEINKKKVSLIPVTDYIQDEYFSEKYIIKVSS